jgi:hypothetical protein
LYLLGLRFDDEVEVDDDDHDHVHGRLVIVMPTPLLTVQILPTAPTLALPAPSYASGDRMRQPQPKINVRPVF